MNATRLAAPLLLLLAAGCRSVEPDAAPPGRPADPRLAHAREAVAWQRFDANLAMLHRARRSIRSGVLLPAAPPAGNEIETAAWAAAKASERSRLAEMVQQEALNDLTHARQAVELAEDQVEATQAARAEAMRELTEAVRRLQQVVGDGDAERNRRVLERFASTLPAVYRSTLNSLVRTN